MSPSTIRSSISERGFTLIEIMASIALLGLTLMALAPVTMRVGRLSTGSTSATQCAAVLAGEVQRLEQVDFAALTAGTTCYNRSSADFPHYTCVKVTDLNGTTKRLVVVVSPVGALPDSVIVDKTSGSRYNPLSQ